MSKLIAFVSLLATSGAAMAAPVPTPDVLPLLGIGVLAVVAARRFKK